MVSLGGEDLVVVATKGKTVLLPCVEVCADINGSADSLLLPDAPELGEGTGSLNGWLVVAHRLEDVVGAPIDVDGALLLSSRRRVVAAPGLDDVVLDEGVLGPAVERNVGVLRCGIPGTRVGNGAGCSGLPSLSGNKVANVVPGGGVFATILVPLTLLRSEQLVVGIYLVVVGHLTLVISPEGVEETIVGTSSGRSLDTTLEKSERRSEVDGASKHRGSGAKGEEDGRECDHVDDGVVVLAWWVMSSRLESPYILVFDRPWRSLTLPFPW